MCDTSYEVAQICENGHIITIRYNSEPHSRKDFCPECGANTFTECPHCRAPLQGSLVQKVATSYAVRSYHYDEYSNTENDFRDIYHDAKFKFPKYCHVCGKPLPWTEAILKESSELIDLMDELTDEQKQALKEYIPNIITETSSTKSSAIKITRLLKPVGEELAQALKSTLIDQTVKTALQLLGWQSA